MATVILLSSAFISPRKERRLQKPLDAKGLNKGRAGGHARERMSNLVRAFERRTNRSCVLSRDLSLRWRSHLPPRIPRKRTRELFLADDTAMPHAVRYEQTFRGRVRTWANPSSLSPKDAPTLRFQRFASDIKLTRHRTRNSYFSPAVIEITIKKRVGYSILKKIIYLERLYLYISKKVSIIL